MVFDITASNYKKPGLLPYGYTQLDYIRSSGTQYIDTGFIPNNNTRVTLDIDCLELGTIPYFGSRKAQNNQPSFTFWVLSTTSIRSDYGTLAKVEVTRSDILGRKIVEMNKNNIKFGTYTKVNSTQTFNTGINLLLLAVQSSTTTVDARRMKAKLYSCQVYDNGTLVRNFIPCKNPSGVIGLYDSINNKFYNNAGTGTFSST